MLDSEIVYEIVRRNLKRAETIHETLIEAFESFARQDVKYMRDKTYEACDRWSFECTVLEHCMYYIDGIVQPAEAALESIPNIHKYR